MPEARASLEVLFHVSHLDRIVYRKRLCIATFCSGGSRVNKFELPVHPTRETAIATTMRLPCITPYSPGLRSAAIHVWGTVLASGDHGLGSF